MKDLYNAVKKLIFKKEDADLEYVCNQVLNYNNFEQAADKKSKNLYRVCSCIK